MGIMYFALGMLSMLGLIFVGIIIWGMVKVVKIQKKIRVIEQLDRDRFDGVYSSFDDIRNDYRREFEHFHRDVTDKFNKIEQHEIKRFDELLGIIRHQHDISIKYTDKRIDKSLNNTYTVQTTTLKEIL